MGEGAPVVDPPTFSTENFDTEIKKNIHDNYGCLYLLLNCAIS